MVIHHQVEIQQPVLILRKIQFQLQVYLCGFAAGMEIPLLFTLSPATTDKIIEKDTVDHKRSFRRKAQGLNWLHPCKAQVYSKAGSIRKTG